MSLSNQQIDQFISQQRLPDKFRDITRGHYEPLAAWIVAKYQPGKTLLVGINGAQGTGKSTLARFLRLVLESVHGWRVAVLSIDDFYLTGRERRQLSERVHPLLATRGVPGTHDVQMLLSCIEQLSGLDAGETLSMPRFDKAIDERADPSTWPIIKGPVDLIILEGWCVGSRPQSGDVLQHPLNVLEREEDVTGSWRCYVNEQLGGSYADLFRWLDALIFLRAPNFAIVKQWRLEQEEKLAAVSPADSPGILGASELRHFIQHYERLTRASLDTLTATADVVLELDSGHGCVHTEVRNR